MTRSEIRKAFKKNMALTKASAALTVGGWLGGAIAGVGLHDKPLAVAGLAVFAVSSLGLKMFSLEALHLHHHRIEAAESDRRKSSYRRLLQRQRKSQTMDCLA